MSHAYSAIVRKRREQFAAMDETMVERAMQTLYCLHGYMKRVEKNRGPQKRSRYRGSVTRRSNKSY